MCFFVLFLVEDINDDFLLKWKVFECLKEYCYLIKFDVWVFGVVMYEVLIFGCFLFGNLSDEDVYNYVSDEI